MTRSIFDHFGGQRYAKAAQTPADQARAQREPKPMIRTRASRIGGVFDRMRRKQKEMR